MNALGMAHCDSDIITDATGKVLLSPANPPSGSYGPAQFRGAYGESGTTSITRTVAIVDAYDDPTALADLNTYSTYYGISTMSSCAVSGGTYSSPCFQVVNENGGSTLPPSDGQGVNGWAGEISLDVQSVHAMCQNCNILLVEATSASDYDLIEVADQTAVSMGANVVSNSWGECESGPNCEGSGETSLDSYFNHPGVPFIFSSGDGAYLDGTQYPAASPYVTAVGGTSLYLNLDNSYNSETVWFTSPIEGAGSGCSAYEPKPSFQHDSGCSKRTVADVSADADPVTGAAVLVNGSWGQIGGTSLAAPLIASVYALAGGVGSTLGNSLPYANVSYGVNMRDVTSGSNGSCSGSYLCTAGTGYDGPTGLGTPLGTAAFTPHYTISGNAGVAGVTLSYTDGTAKTATSGSGGSYSFAVSYNWSGTVTPSLAGYAFSPTYRSYTNVLANQTSQNYTATVIYTISGNAGVAGVTLSYTDGTPKTATSADDGSYSFTVSHNWYGTVTPSNACYTFNPTSLSYSNVTSNQTSQNYTPTINSGCANVNVSIAGTSQGTYGLPSQGSVRPSYAGVNNGPVTVRVRIQCIPIIATERLGWAVNGIYSSIAEMLGLPSNQLTNSYTFAWYNDATMDTQLRIGNVGASSTNVTVTIAGTGLWTLHHCTQSKHSGELCGSQQWPGHGYRF